MLQKSHIFFLKLKTGSDYDLKLSQLFNTITLNVRYLNAKDNSWYNICQKGTKRESSKQNI